ncbi:MAG: DUF370 domain-containing protein [Desulfitobacterium sp.]|nr:DUF370 domain-containing protein [Desulfitobacterium sp.]
MFLHLGGDILISQEKIIAILDLETVMRNSASEKFLNNIINNGDIQNITTGKEKSLVVTVDGNYLSPISSTTLLKRSDSKRSDSIFL